MRRLITILAIFIAFTPCMFIGEAFSYDQRVKDELVIQASGKDVTAAIKEFRGEIVQKMTKLDIYVVKFPVSDISELDFIKEKLNKKGIQATYNFVMNLPDDPHAPQ